MKEVPSKIVQFIESNHVAGLAVLDHDGMPWASSCFYVFDKGSASLVIASNRSSRHGQALLHTPAMAGTIAAQPAKVRDIVGIQFRAEASLLSGDERTNALDFYCSKFPFARMIVSDLWRLSLNEIKHTSNVLVFGQKTVWKRQ